jgi:hypothetical protein
MFPFLSALARVAMGPLASAADISAAMIHGNGPKPIEKADARQQLKAHNILSHKTCLKMIEVN